MLILSFLELLLLFFGLKCKLKFKKKKKKKQALINQTGVEDVTLRCALFNMITANIEPDDAAV